MVRGSSVTVETRDLQLKCLILSQNDTILVMPTVPDIPPKLGIKADFPDEFRARAFDLLSVSGMSGCCQVGS